MIEHGPDRALLRLLNIFVPDSKGNGIEPGTVQGAHLVNARRAPTIRAWRQRGIESESSFSTLVFSVWCR